MRDRKEIMKVIVCLGNPGAKYERNRHNVGFRVGDALRDKELFSGPSTKFSSAVYKGNIEGESVLLLYPNTYMNLSGKAVQACLSFYKAESMDLLVIYDDIDIDFGELRFRKKGGPGTHNGLRSIVGLLGTRDFPRLRVGVGPVPQKRDLADFVLANFDSIEEADLPNIFQRSIETIKIWIKEDEEAAIRSTAQKINTKGHAATTNIKPNEQRKSS